MSLCHAKLGFIFRVFLSISSREATVVWRPSFVTVTISPTSDGLMKVLRSTVVPCMRYIELNPVRAGMVETPGEYRWSSYTVNTAGEVAGSLTPHEAYKDLGTTAVKEALPIVSYSGRY